jgi:hypothetical protein
MKRLLLIFGLIMSLSALSQGKLIETHNYSTNNYSLVTASSSTNIENDSSNSKHNVMYYLIPAGAVIVLALLTVAIRKRILFDS